MGPQPEIYRMKIFSDNEMAAKSRFWYFLHKLRKMKKTTGDILTVKQIFEEKPGKLKNYGIYLRYTSRSIHNMYKEYRDTTLTSAVGQLYSEMASRHRARNRSIQIIRTCIVPDEDCRRQNTLQYLGDDVKFPLPHRRPRPTKRNKNTFLAKRPRTFVH